MTTEAIKSTQITNLDASPVVRPTTGENSAGMARVISGYCSVSATGIAAAGSTYQLLRFPVHAKVKSLHVWSDVAIDSNASQQLALDFNVAFSTSTVDGTAVANQGAIPTTANTGAVTTVAAYSSPNKLFGTITLSGNNAKITETQLATGSANYTSDKFLDIPMWSVFGFTDGQSNANPPGGNFDLLAYVATAAATGHAGKLFARMVYVE